MKRIIFPIFVTIVLTLSLFKSVDCLAFEPYHTNLIDAELTSQERIDYYNKMLETNLIKSYLDEINSYKHVFASLAYDEGNLQKCWLSFYCFNDDYVAYLYAPNGSSSINFISKSNEKIIGKCYSFQASLTDLNRDGSLTATLQNEPFDYSLDTLFTKNDIHYYKRDYWSGVTGASTANDGRHGVVKSDVPVFRSENDAILYLEDRDVKPLYYDTSSTVYYNGDDLYFKEFTVIPHVTNNYDTFYFDVKYELSNFAKEHITSLNLRFDNSYAMGVEGLASLVRFDADNSSYSISISVSDKPNGFRLYLKEIPCLYSLVDDKKLASKNNILGKEFLIDFSKLSIDGVGLDTIASINHSYLYCQFYLRGNINGKFYQGQRNDFNYDFLTKKSDFDIWKSTDDSSLNGNLNYVRDGQTVTSNEYYYNDVTTNDNGTTVNNYYYYDNDGNRKKITEDEYFGGNVNANGGNASIGDINININNNMGQDGEYITISPVDFNQFIKGMANMLKMFDTNGGLFLLLKDIFSLFPDDVNTIAIGAIGAITFVSAVCILRRR